MGEWGSLSPFLLSVCLWGPFGGFGIWSCLCLELSVSFWDSLLPVSLSATPPFPFWADKMLVDLRIAFAFAFADNCRHLAWARWASHLFRSSTILLAFFYFVLLLLPLLFGFPFFLFVSLPVGCLSLPWVCQWNALVIRVTPAYHLPLAYRVEVAGSKTGSNGSPSSNHLRGSVRPPFCPSDLSGVSVCLACPLAQLSPRTQGM